MLEEIKFSAEFELLDQDSKIIAEAPDTSQIDSLPRVWINSAKEGQVIDVNGELCSMTREGLESSVGSWKNGKILDNHKTERKGFKIYEDRFESPFLAFLLDEKTAKAVKDGSGGSIDGIALKVEDKKILKLRGVGYSILDKDNTPSCTPEAGCGIAGEGTAEKKGGNVNIPGSNLNPNIKLDKIGNGKNPDPNKPNIKKENDKKEMLDEKGEKLEVSFSKEQVAEIQAAAVVEASENLTALHKVEIGDLEKAHVAELKTLGDTHTTEMETQRVEVAKKIQMVESLATKYALSDAAKKGLTEAKTLEEALTLFQSLKVEKAEPVIAAEGKAETGCGIILGSEIEGKAPETIKVEQIGNYDPYTGKYEPTYREELK